MARALREAPLPGAGGRLLRALGPIFDEAYQPLSIFDFVATGNHRCPPDLRAGAFFGTD